MSKKYTIQYSNLNNIIGGQTPITSNITNTTIDIHNNTDNILIALGGNHSILIKKDTEENKIFACGKNSFGQLGLGNIEEKTMFTILTNPLPNITTKQVVCGDSHTLIITEVGKVFACGNNSNGQLGLGDINNRNIFTEVPPLPDGKTPKQVVAGLGHTIILTEDNIVFACGLNEHGQLGMNHNNNRNTFINVPFPGINVPKQVVAGRNHTMILTDDGTVFACGANEYGQLGLGHTNMINTFTQVPALPGGKVAKQVIAGDYHTMILAEDGTVFACGANSYGQLGIGNFDNKNNFVEVSNPNDLVKQVIAGGYHTMIITENGRVSACGNNSYGQLGIGNFDMMNTFTQVPPLPGGKVAKQVITGDMHTMILTEDMLFACGRNSNGQLGLRDRNNRANIQRVMPLVNI